MARNHATIGIALRLFCAALLIALGFAHRPMTASAMPMDMAAYMLPDGTIPTLCLPEHADSKSDKDMAPRCEACRISSAAVLPMPSCEASAITLATERVAFVAAPERFHRLAFPPNAPPRGPPALPVSFVTA